MSATPGSLQVVAENLLARTLIRMRDSPHGGTLLVLPDHSDSTRLGDFLDIRFPIRSDVLKTVILDCSKLPQTIEAGESASQVEEMHFIHQRLDHAVETLSALSSVDGAVVIDREFRLHGFGAIVSIPNPAHAAVPQMAYRYADRDVIREVETGHLDTKQIGTRHRSSIQLTQALPNTIAIVVSEDGGITIAESCRDNVASVHRDVEAGYELSIPRES